MPLPPTLTSNEPQKLLPSQDNASGNASPAKLVLENPVRTQASMLLSKQPPRHDGGASTTKVVPRRGSPRTWKWGGLAHAWAAPKNV
jgi:hypothetical protein